MAYTKIVYKDTLTRSATANSIPKGFFTGTVGTYTGLFFRHFGGIVHINDPEANWTWGDISDLHPKVEHYRAVDVEITVSEA